jgi:sulfocyanin SoxE-like protein
MSRSVMSVIAPARLPEYPLFEPGTTIDGARSIPRSSERVMNPLFRRQEHAWIVLAIIAGASASACSPRADQARGPDTTASDLAVGSTGTTSGAVSESVSTTNTRTKPSETSAANAQQDTVRTSKPQNTTASRSSPTAPSKKTPTVPKPSIDPGRLPPKTSADTPSSAARAAKDSSNKTTPSSSTGDQYVKYDASTNTATFELVAGPFTWNGTKNGSATLVLPPKANVVVNFVNKDGTPHSAEVISGEGAIPNASTDPALPRAYTNKALEGLPQEATDVMRFTVPESGTYRIFCGVPGHGLSGMWIWMKVDPAAKTASFGPTKT